MICWLPKEVRCKWGTVKEINHTSFLDKHNIASGFRIVLFKDCKTNLWDLIYVS